MGDRSQGRSRMSSVDFSALGELPRGGSRSKPGTPVPPANATKGSGEGFGPADQKLAGKEYHVTGIEAAFFVWNALWSPQKPNHVELNILDVVMLQNGAIASWIFTTKEGVVKCKSKRRWNATSIVDRARDRENNVNCFAWNGTGWSYVTNEETATHLVQNSAGKAALLCYGHLVPTIIPTAINTAISSSSSSSSRSHSHSHHSSSSNAGGQGGSATPDNLHSSFLSVDYEYIFHLDQRTAGGNDIGKPRIRYWSLCRSQAMGKANAASNATAMLRLPSERVVCRNQSLCNQGNQALKHILKVIETDTGRRVSKISLVFFVQDGATAESTKLWFFHASEICLVHKSNSNVNVEAMLSGGEGASIASSLSLATSLANIYFKPFCSCEGDFCRYLHDMADGGSNLSLDTTGVLGEDEGFDIKNEAQKAIARHRPGGSAASAPGSASPRGDREGVDEAVGRVYELVPTASRSAAVLGEDRSHMQATASPSKFSTASLRSLVPPKERTVLNKSVACAREEMEAVERIEAQFGGQDSEARQLEMKERLAAVWPMHIVRWWLGAGRNQRKNPRLGRVSVVSSKAPAGTNVAHTAHILRERPQHSDGSLPEGEACGQKWFSYHHTPCRVCESCYRVYSELDKHRDKRLLAMKEKPPAMDRDQERDLERRIFRQRKACSQLSQPRSTARLSQDDLMPSPKPRKGLPPVARRAELSTEPRLVQHIMKRAVRSLPALPVHDAVDDQWREATDQTRWNALNAYVPPRLVPVEVDKPKVDVSDYTAERLLHPWQRDLQHMKRLAGVARGENEPSQAGPPSHARLAPLEAPTTSGAGTGPGALPTRPPLHPRPPPQPHVGEEDEDDEDELALDTGKLGWNPFSL